MTNQPDTADIDPTFDLFEPLLNQTFEVPFADEVFTLTLVQARLLKHYVPEIHRRPPFSLLFHCPDVRILPQYNHTLKHERFGAQDVFLVPVAGDAQGVSYEAVFN